MSETPQELGDRDALDERITQMEIGTNTLHAIVVNGKTLIAVTDDGRLDIDDQYAGAFTYAVSGGVAHVGGGAEIEGVSFDFDPSALSIGGNTLTEQTFTRLLVTIRDTGEDVTKVNFAVE